MSTMRAFFVILLAFLTITPPGQPAFPQSDDLKALRKEIEALKEEQRAIRKEIQDLSNSLRERGGPSTRDVRDLTISIGHGPSQGNHTAVLTLVEFSDFECPICGRHSRETFAQIRRDYIDTGKLKYVFRDFPIEDIHRNAFLAAEAAHCAGEQGQYCEMVLGPVGVGSLSYGSTKRKTTGVRPTHTHWAIPGRSAARSRRVGGDARRPASPRARRDRSRARSASSAACCG